VSASPWRSNHLKSKGSDCNAVGDPDLNDGQGNCNGTRTAAANAEATWLAADPTGSGDPDFLIIGDLNAYSMEDPITALKETGYTDLRQQFVPEAWTYAYQGQIGSLDHALASVSLTSQVGGAGVWQINADEPVALDYNSYNQAALYQPNPFRSSDHNPTLIGLNLTDPPYDLYFPIYMGD
jgi:predicted extracellular nuclease